MPRRLPIKFADGTRYRSLADAARGFGVSKETMRARLDKWQFPFSDEMPKTNGSTPRPITYEGTYYPSLTKCAENEGISISAAHQYANKADLERRRKIDANIQKKNDAKRQ